MNEVEVTISSGRIAKIVGERQVLYDNAAVKIDQTAKLLEDRLKEIPQEKQKVAEPYIAVPAIQQLFYSIDSVELREMYANLLASSMNVDKYENVHPGYVEILKQLMPDEVRLLNTLNPLPVVSYPLIDVNIKTGSNGFSSLIRNFTTQGIEALEHPSKITSYIDNLSRLGLIRIHEDMHMTDSKKYTEIETNGILNAMIDYALSKQLNHDFKHKLFHLTEYGASFLKVCK